jgi:hypothetical protein
MPEGLALAAGQSEARGVQEDDDPLRIAQRLGPALLDGAENGFEGHYFFGTSFIHFLGILSFEF